MKQKTGSGNASVTHSTETQHPHTTPTHFWQFYRQMEGCALNTSTTDLIDASGAVMKTSKEKGSALLQRFVQQSNQNNLDERKAVWKRLDRTLTEARSNEDLITGLEFTEALSGRSKDIAPAHGSAHTALYFLPAEAIVKQSVIFSLIPPTSIIECIQ